MNDGWRELRLEEVASLDGRKAASFSGTRYYVDTGSVSGRSISGELTAVTYSDRPSRANEDRRAGDVGFSKMKLSNKTVLVTEETQRHLYSTGFQFLRPTPDVLPEFLFLICSSSRFRRTRDALTGDGIMGSISKRNAASITVLIPPRSDQMRIVDLVGSIDSYIDSLQTQVDATRTARSALLADLLSNAGDDWRFARLGDVSTLQIGRTPPRSEAKYWSTDLERPFCTIADMNGRHCRPVREGVTELAEQEGKAKRMPAGTLLMSFKLTIGRVAFADCDLFPNEAIVSISPDRRAVTADFLYYFLGSQDLTRESGQAVKGKTLNGASLRSIEVLLPSLEEQQEIVDLMDAVERKIELVDSQRDAALKLRSGVLSELLSGERLLDESYDALVSL